MKPKILLCLLLAWLVAPAVAGDAPEWKQVTEKDGYFWEINPRPGVFCYKLYSGNKSLQCLYIPAVERREVEE